MDLNEKLKLTRNTNILENNFQAFINERIKDYDLRFCEFSYLITLYENDGASQDFIAKKKATDKAAITRVINSLEKKELVIREKNVEDKRINNIFLTEKALSYKEDLNKYLDEWFEVIKECMSEEEYLNLANSLEKLTNELLSKLGKH